MAVFYLLPKRSSDFDFLALRFTSKPGNDKYNYGNNYYNEYYTCPRSSFKYASYRFTAVQDKHTED